MIQNTKQTEQDDYEKMKNMNLADRLKNASWSIRKKTYEQLLYTLQTMNNVDEELIINGQSFTMLQLIPFLNNLVDEKHPNVLLKGLECVECIMKCSKSSHKQFLKLIDLGLDRFPLLTQQKKLILETFFEILKISEIDANILKHKLSLPQQKVVMFVIEVIGALGITELRGKLEQMSRTHNKACIKELSHEILSEFDGNDQAQMPVQKITVKKDQQYKVKSAATSTKSKTKVVQVKSDIIQKLQTYETIASSQQQKFSTQILDNIQEISTLQNLQTVNISHYIRLMIDDNNQITSTNGIKILLFLIKKNSLLIQGSFPLLFIFNKFKMHKTHPINTILYQFLQTVICSNRSIDIVSAAIEGMVSSSSKSNVKYGCIMSYIRIVALLYQNEEIFNEYCLGEYTNLYDSIENKKGIEKFLPKGVQVLSKEKGYASAYEQIVLLVGSKKGEKGEQSKKTTSIYRSKSNVENIQSNKLAIKTQSKQILSPQPQLHRILQLTEQSKSSKFQHSTLEKRLQKCLSQFKQCLKQNRYQLFYYCELLDSFIQKYVPNDETAEDISLFLIECMKSISTIDIPQNRRKSKISQSGLELFFKITICKLSLSSDLTKILNNINASFDFVVIFEALKVVFIKLQQSSKKKNRKYLIKWLQSNTPEEYVNQDYYQLITAVEHKNQNKKTQTQEFVENNRQLDEKKDRQMEPKKNEEQDYKINQRIDVKREQKFKESQTEEKQKYIEKPYQIIKKQTPSISIEKKKEEKQQIFAIALKENNKKIEAFQNIENEISHIQNHELDTTERIDDKWEYFLSKNNPSPMKEQKQIFHNEAYQQQKCNSYSQQFEKPSLTTHKNNNFNNNFNIYQSQSEHFKQQINAKDESMHLPSYVKEQQLKQEEEDDHSHYEQEQQPEKEHKFEYKLLNTVKLLYMMTSTNNPYPHLRNLIIIPYKSQKNKVQFIKEFIHFINEHQLKKPIPFNSILLVVILLFSEIKDDKSLIQPLQSLYESMAKLCSTNQFLKVIISLFHQVIQETASSNRRFLLTILTKSMTRMMPFVQDALQLLKDLQQFYQIGEMVYFEMFINQYQQIKDSIEQSQCLAEVVEKAYKDEGENLPIIVAGWLDTQFKREVQQILQACADQS